MSKSIPLSTVPKPHKKNFLNYIHNFRGLAILFVVAGHVLLQWPKNSFTYKVFQVIWENGTILFVFIAGYLFQHLSAKFEYRNYLVKKLQNVLIPYIIISIPILIYRLKYNEVPGNVLNLHHDFNSWGAIKKTFYYLLHGAHLLPLWFVPMIILFYLCAPLFIYIDRNPKFYYLLLAFILVSFIVERRESTDIIRMFVHFFSVYLFGMFMSRYKNEYIKFSKKYYLFIIAVTLLVLSINIFFFEYNKPLNYLHKMLFCSLFIYLMWRYEHVTPKLFGYFANISFGMFFMHYYFVLLCRSVTLRYFPYLFQGNALNWAVALVFILFFCVLFIEAIKRISFSKSKYIIGS